MLPEVSCRGNLCCSLGSDCCGKLAVLDKEIPLPLLRCAGGGLQSLGCGVASSQQAETVCADSFPKRSAIGFAARSAPCPKTDRESHLNSCILECNRLISFFHIPHIPVRRELVNLRIIGPSAQNKRTATSALSQCCRDPDLPNILHLRPGTEKSGWSKKAGDFGRNGQDHPNAYDQRNPEGPPRHRCAVRLSASPAEKSYFLGSKLTSMKRT